MASHGVEKTQTPAEIEAELADEYLNGAVLARTVSYKALELALEQIEAGTLRDPAKTAMNAAITSGTLLDKRLLLQERPTQILKAEDPKVGALRLARRLGVALEATATDITETPALEAPRTESLPLLSESAPAKRARVREKRQPAD